MAVLLLLEYVRRRIIWYYKLAFSIHNIFQSFCFSKKIEVQTFEVRRRSVIPITIHHPEYSTGQLKRLQVGRSRYISRITVISCINKIIYNSSHFRREMGKLKINLL